MTFSHKYFTGGYRSDGDSSDLPRDSVSDGQNVDLDVILGEVTVRPAVSTYNGQDSNDSPPLDHPTPSGAMTGVNLWTHNFKFDSGISPVQRSTMIVYRSENIISGINYRWEIWTNACLGGDGYGWTMLETNIFAPSCRLYASRGTVRIVLGNGNHMRIFKKLVDTGGSVTLFSGSAQTVTITESTGTGAGGQSYGTGLGGGGIVFRGWLYDYARCYYGPLHQIGWTSMAWSTGTSTTDALDMYPAFYEFLIVLVLDDQPEIFGMVNYALVRVATTDTTMKITIDPSSLAYSKRITGIALYAKKTNTVVDSDADFRRIRIINVKTETFPYVFTFSQSTVNVTEGVWSVDGDERPALTTALATGVGISLAAPLSTADVTTLENDLDVKATGLAIRKETLYAWGIDNDPGQERIAFTSMGERRGMFDVWYKMNWGVKDVGKSLTFLTEYNDKLFGTYENNCWYVDVTDRLYVENRRDYMSHKEGLGVGLPLVMAQNGGIVKSVAGLFWRNYNSIYKFTGSIPLDLLENRWKKEYQAYSIAARETAVMGYNEFRSEFWFAIRDSADGVDPETWKIYVWKDLSNIAYWHPPYRIQNFKPMGFCNDYLQRFVMWGRFESSKLLTIGYLNTSGTTAGEMVDFGSYNIDCHLKTQSDGERSNEMLVDVVDLERELITGASAITVSFFPDASSTAWGNSVVLSPSMDKMQRIKTIRCNELKTKIAWSHTVGETTRARIKELTIFATSDLKRRT